MAGEPGARIPKALWAAAVEMAREVGVAQTVQQLRVEGTRPAPVPDPQPLTFVAWPKATPAAPVGTPGCMITCQNAHGQTLEVRLQGAGLSQLAPLCAAFWRAP